MKAIILEIWSHSERNFFDINFPLSNAGGGKLEKNEQFTSSSLKYYVCILLARF